MDPENLKRKQVTEVLPKKNAFRSYHQTRTEVELELLIKKYKNQSACLVCGVVFVHNKSSNFRRYYSDFHKEKFHSFI